MWKLVRKAVAVAFSAACIRCSFPFFMRTGMLFCMQIKMEPLPGPFKADNTYCHFMKMARRKKFAIVRSKVEVLAAALSKLGPEQSCDLDNAGMRLALDVVSLVRCPDTSWWITYRMS